VNFTKNNNINYVYPENENLIFELESNLIDSLARAKISLCFPKSVTHPEIANSISKVTMRYFQSMASKSLILGKAPADMKELFDYNPVIEIDEAAPVKQ